jgi:hypothetical protein
MMLIAGAITVIYHGIIRQQQKTANLIETSVVSDIAYSPPPFGIGSEDDDD